jgi:hypothetical protein
MDGQNTENTQNMEEIQIERKAIRLNESMWGSYKYLSPIAKPGDYIIPLGASNQGNDVWLVAIKVINVKKEKVNANE